MRNTSETPDQPLFYEKRYSPLLIIAALCAAAVSGFFAVATQGGLLPVAGCVLSLFILLFFYCQEVLVDTHELYITYGLGLLSRAFEFTEVRSVVIGQQSSFLAWFYDPMATETLLVHLRQGGSIVIASKHRRRLADLLRGRIEARL